MTLKTCCPWIYDGLAAGDTPTKPNISAYTTGTQAGQVRARAAGVQDHRQQDKKRFLPAAGLEILETLKRLRCSRSEPLPGRLGGLDVELLQKVAQKKGCLRSGGTLAAGSLNRAKSHTKKDNGTGISM